MALKAILSEEEYGQVGDTLKGEYTKSGDGYKLDVEAVNGLGLVNAATLSSEASSAISAKEKAESKLAKLQEKVGDFDLDQLGAARKAMNEMKDWDPDEKLKAHKEQFEEQTRNAFKTEYDTKEQALLGESAKKDALIESRTGQLKETLFESRALQLCVQYNADPTIISVMRDRGMIGWEEDSETGRINPIVLDDNRQKRMGVDGEGRMVSTSLEDLFSECQSNADKWGIFFKPPEKPGSGAGGSQGGGGGAGAVNPWDPKSFNLTKQVELYRKDPELAKRLAAAAGKPLVEIPK